MESPSVKIENQVKSSCNYSNGSFALSRQGTKMPWRLCAKPRPSRIHLSSHEKIGEMVSVHLSHMIQPSSSIMNSIP